MVVYLLCKRRDSIQIVAVDGDIRRIHHAIGIEIFSDKPKVGIAI